MKPEIIDDFLTVEEHEKIKDIMTSTSFEWYYSKEVNTYDDDNYFTHMFYDHHRFIKSQHFDLVTPILKKINPDLLVRVKGNMYMKSVELKQHAPHVDYKFKHYGAIYSINSCDGYTYIGEEKYQSKANRLLIFDPSVEHGSSTTTDEKHRININFNLVKF